MSATGPAAAIAAKRVVLDALAQVLAMLAGRLRAQGGAAHQIALLTARAEQLAAQAWELANSRYPSGASADDLATAMRDFIEGASALTARAAREAASTRDVATILAGEASKLGAIGRALDGVDDMSLIRARLRPMLDTLAAVPERLKSMTGVANDVVQLGERARDLVHKTRGLHENARSPGIAAVAIYRELRDFADAAGMVAAEIAADDDRIRDAITSMTAQASQLASPEAAAAAQRDTTVFGRMEAVLARGAAPSQSRPAPKPPPGIDWGSAGKR